MKTEWRLSENLDLHFFPTNSPTHPRILRLSLWVTICDSPITNGCTILIYHIHSWWKCPQSVFCCVSFFSRQHGLCSLSIVSLLVISLFPLFLLCNSFLRVSFGSSCERLYKCFWFKCKTGAGNVKTRTSSWLYASMHQSCCFSWAEYWAEHCDVTAYLTFDLLDSQCHNVIILSC